MFFVLRLELLDTLIISIWLHSFQYRLQQFWLYRYGPLFSFDFVFICFAPFEYEQDLHCYLFNANFAA